MPEVTIYTTSSCPYCVQAKRLLDHKGVPYREIDVSADTAMRQHMMQASGRRTVPQIFIGDESIGGFEELRDLDQNGELDDKLGAPA
ncbi:MAG: glutaredoxin 3 [Candidatus Binatia bacterium]